MILTIYSKSGTILYETDKFKYAGSFMSDRTITLTAESPYLINFTPGCYADFREERYFLKSIPQNKKTASSGSTGDANSYDITLYPSQDDLKDCSFLDIVLGGNSYFTGMTTVEFAGTIHQLTDRIQANLNRLYPSEWTVSVSGTHTESKNVSLSKSSCWDALLLANSLFGFNFTISGKVITINSTGTTYSHVFKYGYGNGLYSITRGIPSSDPVITRLRCYGSSENVPSGYKKGAGSILPDLQYIPSIMLPNYETTGIDYIDSANISIYGIREGNFTDEEIKPTIKGVTGEMIRNAGGKSITDGRIDTIKSTTLIEAGSKVSTFSVDIWDIGFQLEDYRVSGTDVVLNVTDGVLGGRGFVVVRSVANDYGYSLTLSRNSDDSYLLPDENTFLSAGDHFVITGCSMPDILVKIAENNLLSLGSAYLADNDHTKFAYSLGVDEAFMEASEIKNTIKEGDKLQIEDYDVGVNSSIIIQQLNISYGNQPIPKYDITLSDKPILSALDLVKKGIADSVQSSSVSISAADIANRINSIKLDTLINDLFNLDGSLKPSILESTITTIIESSTDFSTGLISGAVLWKEGLTYSSTELDYKILGNTYRSKKQEIILATADQSNPRIDTFYVDTYGNLNVITGTPAPNPSGATLLVNQLLILEVTVAAGASTPEGIDVDWVYSENTGTDWTNSAIIDTYVSVDFNSTSDPAFGTKRIKTSINVPDEEQSAPLHSIGDKYKGGTIFWIDSTGKKGLIVSTEDVAHKTFWSRLSGYSSYSTDGRSSEIGAGKANTDKMLLTDACNLLSVRYCDTYTSDGYNDWYMPSIDELKEMYIHREKLGMITNKVYWSSTETQWNKARCVSFEDGGDLVRMKNNYFNTRAIRAFDDSDATIGVPVPSLSLFKTSLNFVAPEATGINNGVLSFKIKSSDQWLDKSTLIITASLSNKNTGVSILRKGNMMGYNSSDPSWQLVAIPMYSFEDVDEDYLDKFSFNLHYEWPNGIDIGFDDIRYQHTEVNSTSKVKTYRTDYRFAELPNSSRTVFTTLLPYIEGTVELSINGKAQISGVDFFEENGKVRIVYVLDERCGFKISYYYWK